MIVVIMMCRGSIGIYVNVMLFINDTIRYAIRVIVMHISTRNGVIDSYHFYSADAIHNESQFIYDTLSYMTYIR